MKTIVRIIISAYLMITLMVSICLISYNEHNVPDVFGYTILNVDNDNINLLSSHNLLSLSNGDLIFVKDSKDVLIGDKILYYKNSKDSQFDVSLIDDIQTNDGITTFVLSSGYNITESNLIGNLKDTVVYDFLGYILSFYENKIGFLPLLLILIYFIYVYVYNYNKEKFASKIKNKKGTIFDYSNVEILDIDI